MNRTIHFHPAARAAANRHSTLLPSITIGSDYLFSSPCIFYRTRE
ncbi:hypothetical protein [Burkholderia latens]|nr:hypothetical protein [Burkholderia latens]